MRRRWADFFRNGSRGASVSSSPISAAVKDRPPHNRLAGQGAGRAELAAEGQPGPAGSECELATMVPRQNSSIRSSRSVAVGEPW